MKVFVVYADWGSADGSSKPYAAFSSKERAALHIYECKEYWRDHAKIEEMDVDEPALSASLPPDKETI